ncbi:MAG: hypothetical protein LLF94_09975 [Chlamydiales bacterium]|nr:hypothetical protein [Chlamydiales bacterium]
MKYFIALLVFHSVLFADSQYPADITFMVADLRYSKEHGVKICELQHGILSKFMGDAFLYPPRGKFSGKVDDVFAEFGQKKWTLYWDFVSRPLSDTLRESALWTSCSNDTQLFKDKEFLSLAKQVPADPTDILSYPCMIYVRRNTIGDYAEFTKEYPGALVVDAPTHAYWFDKYAMTTLFTEDEELVRMKPEWGLYPKEYSESLASQIKQEIPSEIYVIKPRGAFLGKGVVITSKDDLDKTLAYILMPSEKRAKDPDQSFSYWEIDESDSFIVEKYYQSSLQVYEDKTYDPTMRAAFVFIYNKGKIEVRFLGSYWILPEFAIDDEGTLNQCRKSHGRTLYLPVSDEDTKAVSDQCTEGFEIIYQKMLNQK